MATRVIIPPEAILTPADIPGDHAADDARITALISAAQEEIDGPTGWVGRSFGPQTLEATLEVRSERMIELPYPPIVEIVSMSTLSVTGAVGAIDLATKRVGDGLCIIPGSFRGTLVVEYEAGYDGEAAADGGTGDIPERAKQAIIMAVQHAASLDIENMAIRTEDVEGVGSTTYVVSNAARDLIQTTIQRMLGGLRIYPV